MIRFVDSLMASGILEARQAPGAVPTLTVVADRRMNFAGAFSDELVVSSNPGIRLRLAEMLGQCGLTAIPLESVAEVRMVLPHTLASIVLCDDHLADGRYDDVVRAVRHKMPVIVVSRTGDWPDYVKAMSLGAFDYLPYPPIPGELERIVHGALAARPSGHTRLLDAGLSTRRRKGAAA